MDNSAGWMQRVSLVLALVALQWTGVTGDTGQCEPMTFNECSFNGVHRSTAFPNKLGIKHMSDAVQYYSQFRPLLQLRCSPHLHHFFCFYIFPACSNNDPTAAPHVTFPCRELCHLVQQQCDWSLNSVVNSGLGWHTTDIQCDKLPETECISGELQPPSTTAQVTQPLAHNKSDWRTCDAAVVQVQVQVQVQDGYVPRCGADVQFDAQTKRFAGVWMTVWAALCCAASLVTFITMARDKARFAYPERPIMFVALCYCGYSLAYLVRAAAGSRAVACQTSAAQSQSQSQSQSQTQCHVLVHDQMQPLCTVVFIMTYFFALSAACWWLVFALGWLLSAAVKWSAEAIEARSSYFHVLAWAAPACITSAAIVLRKVQGDELTGMCTVGVWRELDLLILHIVPHGVLLLLSAILLGAGLIALARIRSELVHSCKHGTDKLEKLVLKVTVSAAFYLVPNAAALACSIYQCANLSVWNAAVRRAAERRERQVMLDVTPPAELYIFRIFASLTVGVSLILWICSTKTLRSWRLWPNHPVSGLAKPCLPHHPAVLPYARLAPSPGAGTGSGNNRHPASPCGSRTVQSTLPDSDTCRFLAQPPAPPDAPALTTLPYLNRFVAGEQPAIPAQQRSKMLV